MGIYQKLYIAQQELIAPKDQFNGFGKYKYRSCEGILEALKPIMKDTQMAVILSDVVKEIGGRVYVEATATAVDIETGESVSVTASAREEESKKGMDGSQVTGASSSYARKYALNGLFAIDDNQDSDATNKGEKASNLSGKAEVSNYTPDRRNVEKTANKSGIKQAPDGLLYCEECGEPVMSLKQGGKSYTAEDVAARAMKKHGKQLCWNCQKKHEVPTD